MSKMYSHDKTSILFQEPGDNTSNTVPSFPSSQDRPRSQKSTFFGVNPIHNSHESNDFTVSLNSGECYKPNQVYTIQTNGTSDTILIDSIGSYAQSTASSNYQHPLPNTNLPCTCIYQRECIDNIVNERNTENSVLSNDSLSRTHSRTHSSNFSFHNFSDTATEDSRTHSHTNSSSFNDIEGSHEYSILDALHMSPTTITNEEYYQMEEDPNRISNSDPIDVQQRKHILKSRHIEDEFNKLNSTDMYRKLSIPAPYKFFESNNFSYLPILPLSYFMQMRGGLSYLSKYAKSKFCDENIRFWECVQRFRSMVSETHISNEDLKMYVLFIYNNFLVAGATDEINIDANTRNSVCAAVRLQLATSFITVDLFDGASSIVYKMIDTEIYRPMCVSGSSAHLLYQSIVYQHLVYLALRYESSKNDNNGLKADVNIITNPLIMCMLLTHAHSKYKHELAVAEAEQHDDENSTSFNNNDSAMQKIKRRASLITVPFSKKDDGSVANTDDIDNIVITTHYSINNSSCPDPIVSRLTHNTSIALPNPAFKTPTSTNMSDEPEKYNSYPITHVRYNTINSTTSNTTQTSDPIAVHSPVSPNTFKNMASCPTTTIKDYSIIAPSLLAPSSQLLFATYNSEKKKSDSHSDAPADEGNLTGVYRNYTNNTENLEMYNIIKSNKNNPHPSSTPAPPPHSDTPPSSHTFHFLQVALLISTWISRVPEIRPEGYWFTISKLLALLPSPLRLLLLASIKRSKPRVNAVVCRNMRNTYQFVTDGVFIGSVPRGYGLTYCPHSSSGVCVDCIALELEFYQKLDQWDVVCDSNGYFTITLKEGVAFGTHYENEAGPHTPFISSTVPTPLSPLSPLSPLNAHSTTFPSILVAPAFEHINSTPLMTSLSLISMGYMPLPSSLPIISPVNNVRPKRKTKLVPIRENRHESADTHDYANQYSFLTFDGRSIDTEISDPSPHFSSLSGNLNYPSSPSIMLNINDTLFKYGNTKSFLQSVDMELDPSLYPAEYLNSVENPNFSMSPSISNVNETYSHLKVMVAGTSYSPENSSDNVLTSTSTPTPTSITSPSTLVLSPQTPPAVPRRKSATPSSVSVVPSVSASVNSPHTEEPSNRRSSRGNLEDLKKQRHNSRQGQAPSPPLSSNTNNPPLNAISLTIIPDTYTPSNDLSNLPETPSSPPRPPRPRTFTPLNRDRSYGEGEIYSPTANLMSMSNDSTPISSALVSTPKPALPKRKSVLPTANPNDSINDKPVTPIDNDLPPTSTPAPLTSESKSNSIKSNSSKSNSTDNEMFDNSDPDALVVIDNCEDLDILSMNGYSRFNNTAPEDNIHNIILPTPTVPDNDPTNEVSVSQSHSIPPVPLRPARPVVNSVPTYSKHNYSSLKKSTDPSETKKLIYKSSTFSTNMFFKPMDEHNQVKVSLRDERVKIINDLMMSINNDNYCFVTRTKFDTILNDNIVDDGLLMFHDEDVKISSVYGYMYNRVIQRKHDTVITDDPDAPAPIVSPDTKPDTAPFVPKSSAFVPLPTTVASVKNPLVETRSFYSAYDATMKALLPYIHPITAISLMESIIRHPHGTMFPNLCGLAQTLDDPYDQYYKQEIDESTHRISNRQSLSMISLTGTSINSRSFHDRPPSFTYHDEDKEKPLPANNSRITVIENEDNDSDDYINITLNPLPSTDNVLPDFSSEPTSLANLQLRVHTPTPTITHSNKNSNKHQTKHSTSRSTSRSTSHSIKKPINTDNTDIIIESDNTEVNLETNEIDVEVNTDDVTDVDTHTAEHRDITDSVTDITVTDLLNEYEQDSLPTPKQDLPHLPEPNSEIFSESMSNMSISTDTVVLPQLNPSNTEITLASDPLEISVGVPRAQTDISDSITPSDHTPHTPLKIAGEPQLVVSLDDQDLTLSSTDYHNSYTPTVVGNTHQNNFTYDSSQEDNNPNSPSHSQESDLTVNSDNNTNTNTDDTNSPLTNIEKTPDSTSLNSLTNGDVVDMIMNTNNASDTTTLLSSLSLHVPSLHTSKRIHTPTSPSPHLIAQSHVNVRKPLPRLVLNNNSPMLVSTNKQIKNLSINTNANTNTANNLNCHTPMFTPHHLSPGFIPSRSHGTPLSPVFTNIFSTDNFSDSNVPFSPMNISSPLPPVLPTSSYDNKVFVYDFATVLNSNNICISTVTDVYTYKEEHIEYTLPHSIAHSQILRAFHSSSIANADNHSEVATTNTLSTVPTVMNRIDSRYDTEEKNSPSNRTTMRSSRIMMKPRASLNSVTLGPKYDGPTNHTKTYRRHSTRSPHPNTEASILKHLADTYRKENSDLNSEYAVLSQTSYSRTSTQGDDNRRTQKMDNLQSLTTENGDLPLSLNVFAEKKKRPLTTTNVGATGSPFVFNTNNLTEEVEDEVEEDHDNDVNGFRISTCVPHTPIASYNQALSRQSINGGDLNLFTENSNLDQSDALTFRTAIEPTPNPDNDLLETVTALTFQTACDTDPYQNEHFDAMTFQTASILSPQYNERNISQDTFNTAQYDDDKSLDGTFYSMVGNRTIEGSNRPEIFNDDMFTCESANTPFQMNSFLNEDYPPAFHDIDSFREEDYPSPLRARLNAQAAQDRFSQHYSLNALDSPNNTNSMLLGSMSTTQVNSKPFHHSGNYDMNQTISLSPPRHLEIDVDTSHHTSRRPSLNEHDEAVVSVNTVPIIETVTSVEETFLIKVKVPCLLRVTRTKMLTLPEYHTMNQDLSTGNTEDMRQKWDQMLQTGEQDYELIEIPNSNLSTTLNNLRKVSNAVANHPNYNPQKQVVNNIPATFTNTSFHHSIPVTTTHMNHTVSNTSTIPINRVNSSQTSLNPYLSDLPQPQSNPLHSLPPLHPNAFGRPQSHEPYLHSPSHHHTSLNRTNSANVNVETTHSALVEDVANTNTTTTNNTLPSLCTNPTSIGISSTTNTNTNPSYYNIATVPYYKNVEPASPRMTLMSGSISECNCVCEKLRKRLNSIGGVSFQSLRIVYDTEKNIVVDTSDDIAIEQQYDFTNSYNKAILNKQIPPPHASLLEMKKKFQADMEEDEDDDDKFNFTLEEKHQLASVTPETIGGVKTDVQSASLLNSNIVVLSAELNDDQQLWKCISYIQNILEKHVLYKNEHLKQHIKKKTGSLLGNHANNHDDKDYEELKRVEAIKLSVALTERVMRKQCMCMCNNLHRDNYRTYEPYLPPDTAVLPYQTQTSPNLLHQHHHLQYHPTHAQGQNLTQAMDNIACVIAGNLQPLFQSWKQTKQYQLLSSHLKEIRHFLKKFNQSKPTTSLTEKYYKPILNQDPYLENMSLVTTPEKPRYKSKLSADGLNYYLLPFHHVDHYMHANAVGSLEEVDMFKNTSFIQSHLITKQSGGDNNNLAISTCGCYCHFSIHQRLRIQHKLLNILLLLRDTTNNNITNIINIHHTKIERHVYHAKTMILKEKMNTNNAIETINEDDDDDDFLSFSHDEDHLLVPIDTNSYDDDDMDETAVDIEDIPVQTHTNTKKPITDPHDNLPQKAPKKPKWFQFWKKGCCSVQIQE